MKCHTSVTVTGQSDRYKIANRCQGIVSHRLQRESICRRHTGWIWGARCAWKCVCVAEAVVHVGVGVCTCGSVCVKVRTHLWHRWWERQGWVVAVIFVDRYPLIHSSLFCLFNPLIFIIPFIHLYCAVIALCCSFIINATKVSLDLSVSVIIAS